MNRLHFTEPAFRTFGDFFNDFVNDTPRRQHSFFPRTNIFETKDGFRVEMLVPGRSKEDFTLSLDKDLLTISYTSKEETEETKDESVVKREFNFHSFKRSFSIDETIDTDGIEANYENGILKLTLPKKEEVKVLPKEITIK